MTDKEKILAKIESLLYETNYEPFTDEVFGRIQSLKELKSYIDSLQEEPVIEDLEEVSKKYSSCIYLEEVLSDDDKEVLKARLMNTFRAGYKFGKEQAEIQIKAQSMAVAHECPKEPVSKDLEEAARKIATRHSHITGDIYYANDAWYFKKGAQWNKENIWKPADGNDLPEIDREVIVLYQRYPLEGNEYAVGFAHRPREFWDGKNVLTGEVTRYYPKRYDKGEWNSPNIKWWLDLELPKVK